jgi:predicted Zn-dependent protease
MNFFRIAHGRLLAVILSVALALGGSNDVLAETRPGKPSLPLIRDAEIEGLLRLYAKPIFKAAGLNAASVRVYVIANPQINAFVSGGQRMFVHTGLFTQSKTPNEVIGVIAHETGHIAGGHLARMNDQLKRASVESIIGMLIGAAATVGGAVSGSSEAAKVGQGIIIGSQGTAQRGFLQYQRSMEASADESALRYLAATKQSAKGMLTMFDRLARQSLATTQNADPYLFSHPMPLERVRTLAERAKASPSFGTADSPALQLRHDLVKAKLSGFQDSPQVVFQRYPKSDTSLPARYARAIAMFRRGDIANALPVIDSLTNDLPRNPYFWELKGQALLENGQAKRAIPALQEARKLLPQQALIQILEAEAYLSAQGPDGAINALRLLVQAQRLEPDNPQVYKLLAQGYAQKGDVPRAELATADYAVLTGDRDLAVEKAAFAQSQFKQGTPEWLRADDILAAAKRKKK